MPKTKPDYFVVYDYANNVVACLPTRAEAAKWAEAYNAQQKVIANASKVWVRPHYA